MAPLLYVRFFKVTLASRPCLRKFSLVIFDCDGVLVDSEYLSAQVLVETFAENRRFY